MLVIRNNNTYVLTVSRIDKNISGNLTTKFCRTEIEVKFILKAQKYFKKIMLVIRNNNTYVLYLVLITISTYVPYVDIFKYVNHNFCAGTVHNCFFYYVILKHLK